MTILQCRKEAQKRKSLQVETLGLEDARVITDSESDQSKEEEKKEEEVNENEGFIDIDQLFDFTRGAKQTEYQQRRDAPATPAEDTQSEESGWVRRRSNTFQKEMGTKFETCRINSRHRATVKNKVSRKDILLKHLKLEAPKLQKKKLNRVKLND